MEEGVQVAFVNQACRYSLFPIRAKKNFFSNRYLPFFFWNFNIVVTMLLDTNIGHIRLIFFKNDKKNRTSSQYQHLKIKMTMNKIKIQPILLQTFKLFK